MRSEIKIADTGNRILTSDVDADGGRRVLEVVEAAVHICEGRFEGGFGERLVVKFHVGHVCSGGRRHC